MTAPTSDAAEPGASEDAGPVAPADPLAPPRLLSRPAAPAPLPPPLGQSEQLAQLHRRWAHLHGAPATGPADPPAPAAVDAGRGAAASGPRIPGGVRGKVRARVATAAAGVQQADRAMTDDLVRSVDALAQRIDEIANRLAGLESLVQDVVDTVSEDLIRLQAAMGHAPPAPPGDPA